jgi:outer membrane lipoprotein-sorting protein
LTAAEVVAKNLTARGGAAAWRSVETLSTSGKMDLPGKADLEAPFLLEQKRGRKSRLEIQFQGKTSIQVYDGTAGWKLRPFLGRKEVEQYSPLELKTASKLPDLDGPLMNADADGTKVEAEGIEKVDGRDTYKLKLIFNNGDVRHLWIDETTFLEAQIDGEPVRLRGKSLQVHTTFKDFRSVQRLMVPFQQETTLDGSRKTRKMTVESVEVNPKLDASKFAKLQ